MNPTKLIANPSYRGPFFAALLVSVVLGWANLIMGDLNQDEGWYLYAAQRVAEGWLPYRDFAFTQGPMMPLVYALSSPLIHHFGLAGGRAVTWLLGMGAIGLTVLAARRLGGAAAGVLAFSLIAVNVYQSYFTTVVKTYSLCALFLMTGVYAMTRWISTSPDKRTQRWLLLSGIGFAAAAGTRLSTGIMIPVVGVWLLFQARRYGSWSWFWFGLGGGFGLVAIFLPFFLMAPEGFRFGLIDYHTLRDGGGFLASLVYKGGFVSRLVQAYFVAFSLLLLLVAAKWWRPFPGLESGYHQSDAFAWVRLMFAGILAVTLVHIMAPFPYDDYQAPVYPMLALVLSVSWTFALRAWSALGYRWESNVVPADPPATRWMVWAVLAMCVAAAFSSPLNQDWMIAGRDRIWWKMKPGPSLLQLQRVAQEVKELDRSGELLTQDTYLAVEAGLRVPRGWEMGPFSYFPDLSDAEASTLHLVNRNALLHTLATSTATVAAISGYGLAIASPHVAPLPPDEVRTLMDALEMRYALIREEEGFGQASTTLKLYRLRPEP